MYEIFNYYKISLNLSLAGALYVNKTGLEVIKQIVNKEVQKDFKKLDDFKEMNTWKKSWIAPSSSTEGQYFFLNCVLVISHLFQLRQLQLTGGGSIVSQHSCILKDT